MTNPPRAGRLFQRFSREVRRFLRRRLPTDTDAEDVLQEVFLRITENVDQLQHAEKVRGWVYGIARRAVADFYRRRERQPEVSHSLDESSTDVKRSSESFAYDDDHDVHEEVLSWLRPMIDELPEKYARPLRWADVDGLKQQEIADRLGLSLPGAKSRIQRARKKLGEVLAACCAVEFGPDQRVSAFRRLQKTEASCCN